MARRFATDGLPFGGGLGAGIGVPPMGGSSSGGGFRDALFAAATGAEETSGIATVATMLVSVSSGSCPLREGNSFSRRSGEVTWP